MSEEEPRKEVEIGASSCRERTRIEGSVEDGRPLRRIDAKASESMSVRPQLKVRM